MAFSGRPLNEKLSGIFKSVESGWRQVLLRIKTALPCTPKFPRSVKKGAEMFIHRQAIN
jgi:hypothetical protein